MNAAGIAEHADQSPNVGFLPTAHRGVAAMPAICGSAEYSPPRALAEVGVGIQVTERDHWRIFVGTRVRSSNPEAAYSRSRSKALYAGT